MDMLELPSSQHYCKELKKRRKCDSQITVVELSRKVSRVISERGNDQALPYLIQSPELVPHLFSKDHVLWDSDAAGPL